MDWTKFYYLRNATLKLSVTWQVNSPTAHVDHLLTGAQVVQLPILLPANPSLETFMAFVDAQDWDTILGKSKAHA